jgi:hypothetical protein
MLLKGIHGTCVTHARAIEKEGIRPFAGGRAGSGFYLWAYLADEARAVQFARDWHSWKLDRGQYAKCDERDCAILHCEIDVDPHAYINLNQARHHEALWSIKTRLPKGEDQAKIFDEYLESQSAFRVKQYGVPLKLVEAMVPYPEATKLRRSDGPPLTPGADAYIVLTEGLAELRVTSVAV